MVWSCSLTTSRAVVRVAKVACQHCLEMDHHWQVHCGLAVHVADATQPVQLPRNLGGPH